MLSNVQEKKIKQLHTKKGREKLNLCLVEGTKSIKTAGSAIKLIFTRNDTKIFDQLVTTETPQNTAAIAYIPQFTIDDIQSQKTIVILDGVQDPGNIGSIFRLCLGFKASLILVNSTDVTNPKVIRSSMGSIFQVPWVALKKQEFDKQIKNIKRPIYRLEKRKTSKILDNKLIKSLEKEITLIAGSEGHGIQIDIKGTSVEIPHSIDLESLNVTHAIAIFLHARIK